MIDDRTGEIAVIFASQRRAGGDDGYAEAAAAMEALAARQPGYHGFWSARGADGFGITVSWWADEASARAWRRHAEHAPVQASARARWYDRYEVAVVSTMRSYAWSAA